MYIKKDASATLSMTNLILTVILQHISSDVMLSEAEAFNGLTLILT